MSDTLVKVEKVSKKFCRDLKLSLWYGMKDLGNEMLGLSKNTDVKLRKDEFWAVNDVSFNLKRGECLGIIGRNGAGKTTLLRMLNGLLKPDKGRIEICGRVCALIALGAGFNPILTGRENIYVNAAVLGLNKKKINAKFDDILDFAELGEFIDAPVQSYSSGMAVRLGFAVATALEPDVLILDEVLAVGDTRFRAKCFQRINSIRHKGGAILLVTHTLEQVAHFCNSAMLLNKGKLVVAGDTSVTLNYYINKLQDETTKKITDINKEKVVSIHKKDQFQQHPYYNPQETRWGDFTATITDICLIQNGHEFPATILPGLETDVKLSVTFHADISEPIYGFSIRTPKGGIIFNTNSRQLLGHSGIPPQKKGNQVQICFGFIPFLNAGEYFASVGIASETSSGIQAHDRRYNSIRFRVAHPLTSTGDIDMIPSFKVVV